MMAGGFCSVFTSPAFFYDLCFWRQKDGPGNCRLTASVLAKLCPAGVLPTLDSNITPCQGWLRERLEEAISLV